MTTVHKIYWVLVFLFTLFFMRETIVFGALSPNQNEEGVVLTDTTASGSSLFSLSNALPGVQWLERVLPKNELKAKLMVIGLLIVVGILLLWYATLWIKTVLFKFIIRLLLKVAIVALIYLVAHQVFFAPSDKTAPKGVQKVVDTAR